MLAWSPAAGSEPRELNPRFSGTPFMRTWTAEDYGGTPAVGAIVEHPRSGFIYVAAGVRILEFDGVRWRAFGATGGTVNTLAVDPRGRIWYATTSDVGYFDADERGELRAVSARARLPGRDSDSGGLGGALATSDGVFFANRHHVIEFPADDGPARVWRFDDDTLVLRLWVQDGAVHVRGTRDAQRLERGEFHPVPNLRTAPLAARADSLGGWQLIGNDGVRRWDGGYRTMVTGELEGDFALRATFLNDGRIAFGTTRRGVIICDAAGHRQQVIDRARGLPSDRIESLCADRAGGLWVGLRSGLVRIQADSPLARHGMGPQPIESSPHVLALHRGELYVGGGEGLWRRDPAGNFHPIADVPFQLQSLSSIGGELYLTGAELRRVEPDDRTRLIAADCRTFAAVSTAPRHFVHGGENGLGLARLEGSTWTPLGRHGKISGATTVLCEWPAGVIWAANRAGFWRIDFRGGVRPDAPARQYMTADGVPEGLTPNNVGLRPWQGGLCGDVGSRLVRFDAATNRFAAETRITGMPRDPSGFIPAAATAAADGTLWLTLRLSAAHLAHVVPAGVNRWRAEPVAQPELSRLRLAALLHDPARDTLWVATQAGLYSRDLAWRAPASAAPFAAAVRRVETPDGTLLWADAATFTRAAPSAAATLQLASEHNALRVLLAAPDYRGDYLGRTHTLFRTRLDGLDPGWSAWQSHPEREFTNLPYRDFTLHVQARDDTGRESQVVTLGFSIAPPWWLTRWAMGGYGVLGLAAMAGLVFWRTRALQGRARRLETIVASRTEDLRRSNVELARLHAIERDEKLAARLAEEKASLEVLRYQLNPHFLYNTLNSLYSLVALEPEAGPMVLRLSEFCRLTLTRGSEFQSVAAEFATLRAYLDIEQFRWGDKLVITLSVTPEAAPRLLPPFLLLPLVENAIKHGLATSRTQLEVRLAARVDAAGQLEVEVANTGRWTESAAPGVTSTGIGLENLRGRLRRYYPDTHTFTIGQEGEWVMARLRLAPPRSMEQEEGGN